MVGCRGFDYNCWKSGLNEEISSVEAQDGERIVPVITAWQRPSRQAAEAVGQGCVTGLGAEDE
jgi:hypothetical protein